MKHDGILKAFSKRLLERSPRTHVITFNYDVLLENFLELEQKDLNLRPKRFHSGRCYGFHANTWSKRKNKLIRRQSEKERDEHLLVMKLHGSVNWLLVEQFPDRPVIISASERNLQNQYQEVEEIEGKVEFAQS